MHRTLRHLQQFELNPKTFSALEVFGGAGQNHTPDIADVVDTLEIWERRPEMEPILRKRFPDSTIKITDSYEEMSRTPRRYDLVVVDNFKKALHHYEHFDLFPAVFRVLNNPAVIILNVIPKVKDRDPERLRQRQAFYNCSSPANIPPDQMLNTYRRLAAQNGWVMEDSFFTRRWTFSLTGDTFYYATLILRSS
ncbi:MAG TPA: hypothetical protein VK897_26555 [Anaerolineales bacterium]|nr:hypothetical protein [Anaerolineales bacterium]